MQTHHRSPKGGIGQFRVKAAPETLDDFPTPPWATRAFVAHMAGAFDGALIVEPAANRGMMAEVLREIPGARVRASDVHDYGAGYKVGSFVGIGPDVVEMPRRVDWIITNPPFSLAEAFLARALDVAEIGVAFLLRTSFLEGAGRAAAVFQKTPPSQVVVCTERVPMVRGRWDPVVSTNMAYSWFVWRRDCGAARIEWLATGARARFGRPDDALRFGARHEFDFVRAGDDRDADRLFRETTLAQKTFRRAAGWTGPLATTTYDPESMGKLGASLRYLRVAIEASATAPAAAAAAPLLAEASA